MPKPNWFELQELTNWIQVFKTQNLLLLLKNILEFIMSCPNVAFNEFKPHGMRLLKKLRVGLSHLLENKFRHSFQDWLGPVSNGSRIIEITTYFFLHCLDIANQRKSSSAKSQVSSALY